MKCPVCGNVNTAMVCPECGFDGSRDYGKYPTLAPVGRVCAASELRKQWQEKQKSPEPVLSPLPEPPKKKKWMPLLIAAAFAVTLGLGVWIGAGIGSSSEPSEPEESAQMQKPPETTEEPNRVVNVIGPWTTNVLGDELLPGWTWDEQDKVRTVTFLNTLSGAPRDAWDVSASGNNAVLAWTKPNDEWDNEYDLYVGAEGGVWAGTSCSSLFADFWNLEKINFNGNFHTDNVQDMSYMFASCNSIVELDLSGFNTANVQSMTGMFDSCEYLTRLDLSSFDTSNTVSMAHMFERCKLLNHLDVRHFDTSKVQDMSYMFSSCWELEELDLSSFDMTNVEDTRSMFFNCPAGDDYQHLLH